ncbi:uncharacterized protein J4E78_004541 [Alternaria triticimaculans]|uniref:uncharacterized protein n=1 Tax=Alternaria triticimaculans TaxID=297637 RepID=UPI0020C43638|nr:uncharacterized protein J4E78_004541 [Alternaria triticimaculans]KAI4661752.1 hypothetical protein J4E78_004541 [Alternaria triticimaculans]
MANIGGEHIDVDTHPYPGMLESLYGKASEVLDPDVGSGESGYANSLIDIPISTHLTSTKHSQHMQPSSLAQFIHPATYRDTTPEDTRPIGAIFAVVLAGIIGFAVPITLLTRYLKRARQETKQMEEEDAVLENVLYRSKLNERAWNVGLKRLHAASIRKWSNEEACAQFVGVLGRPNLDMKTPWLQGCVEREMLEKLFERENRGETIASVPGVISMLARPLKLITDDAPIK